MKEYKYKINGNTYKVAVGPADVTDTLLFFMLNLDFFCEIRQ